MLIRNCAGGMVFNNGKVLIVKNERGNWEFPKEIVHNGDLTNEVVVKKVKEQSGISADIISTAGQTNYDFFSVSRQKPLCDRITWYIMKSLNNNDYITEDNSEKSNNTEKYGFFTIDEAMERISGNQDKALLNLFFKKYNELDCKVGTNLAM